MLGSAADRAAALGALVESARPHNASADGVDASARRDVAGVSPPGHDTGPQVSGDAAELHVVFSPRRWRVRGADRNKTPDTLRVALAVTDERSGGFHLDTLDLCVAKARGAFVDAAVAELHTDRPGLVRELAEVLFATEAAVAARDAAGAIPEMSDAEREEGLALLDDPDLADRVVTDLGALGVVGEETNLLVAYLATISRMAERPFGVVVQSHRGGQVHPGRRGVPAGSFAGDRGWRPERAVVGAQSPLCVATHQRRSPTRRKCSFDLAGCLHLRVGELRTL